MTGQPGTVTVTGAAGKLGRAVVADLQAAGHRVVATDRVEDPGLGVDYHRLDGADLAGLEEVLTGCTALVALASVPAPGSLPPEELFANNTHTPFVALRAAVSAGVGAVALASSGSAYGAAWSPVPYRWTAVPVAEDGPLRNAEEYGLSKQVSEEIAAMFCRADPGLAVAALRFHWVATAAEQRERVAAHRAGRLDPDDELANLWGYVDLRDAARACRLAVETAWRRPFGFVPLNVCATDLLADEPLAELLARHAPDVRLRRGWTGGGFDVGRAGQVIGWRPRHSWRDGD